MLGASHKWEISTLEPEAAHSAKATEYTTELKEIKCILFRFNQHFKKESLYSMALSV